LDTAVELFLLFGMSNPIELFTTKMQQQLKFWSTYGTVCSDILAVSQGSDLAAKVID
jgi:hypothetical protein